MSQVLEQLRCPQCHAPATLVDAAQIACTHCGGAVLISAEYRAAHNAAIALDQTRRAIEPLWKRLSQPPGHWYSLAGYLLVFILPILATLLANLLPSPPMARAEIYAMVTLPAVAPGACLVAWASLVAATVMRFREAMSSRPPSADGGLPRCRTCSAELRVPDDAVAVTCPYCETDNLASAAQRSDIREDLSNSLSSLAEAVSKVRVRRVGIALSMVAIAFLVGGTSALLWLASV